MLVGVIMAGVSGVASAIAILLVIRHAAALRLVATPNERSSHVRPTPTGGGIGIVAGALVASWPLLVAEPRSGGVLLAVGACLALLGLWDDMRPVSPAIRLTLQLLVAGCGTLLLSALPPLSARALPPVFLVAGILLCVLWINLYNFMDGIDGLAGSEGVFLLLAPLALGLMRTPAALDNPYPWWVVAIAVATLAFLLFNWQPARIFMGDAGSIFLGWAIAASAAAELLAGWISPWQAAILPACFLTDSLVTLARRAVRGEAIWQAHRRHAYQHLSRRLGSHRRVVLGVIAIDLLWLLPLAVVTSLLPEAAAPGLTVLAYAPLVAVTLLAGAGRPEHA